MTLPGKPRTLAFPRWEPRTLAFPGGKPRICMTRATIRP